MADPNLDIVLGDLEYDATRWDEAAAEFAEGVAQMERLVLADYVMDGVTYAFGATGSYNETHTQMLDLLRGGAAETARIAQALRDTAANMRAADEAAGG